MTTTLLDRRSRHHVHARPADHTWVTNFSVDVVDGNGVEVAGEPVTASFRFPDGSRSITVVATDGNGRARFDDEHSDDPVEVTVSAGRETYTGAPPALGAALVIET